MANMSYCRFANTRQDLLDCRDNINDYEMSAEELKNRNSLVEICKEIIELADKITEEDLTEE